MEFNVVVYVGIVLMAIGVVVMAIGAVVTVIGLLLPKPRVQRQKTEKVRSANERIMEVISTETYGSANTLPVIAPEEVEDGPLAEGDEGMGVAAIAIAGSAHVSLPELPEGEWDHPVYGLPPPPTVQVRPIGPILAAEWPYVLREDEDDDEA